LSPQVAGHDPFLELEAVKEQRRVERLATGDRVLKQALSDESGHALETLFTDCANVGPPAQCSRRSGQ